MLTADLLRFRTKDGKLLPQLLDPSDKRQMGRATEVFELFGAHVGQTRGELEEALEGLTGQNDAKLVNGLIKIAFDRSELEVQSILPPAAIRALVFRTAARVGPLSPVALEGGRPTAQAVFESVAAELGVDANALEAGLYADAAEAAVLTQVPLASASELLHRYNIALVQAALYDADSLRLTLHHPGPGRLRQLLRAARFCQLIHQARPTEDGVELVIDGPASLLKQGARYGVALARFFPTILLIPEKWSLVAEVARAGRRLKLEVDPSLGLQAFQADHGAYETREARWFAERFEALNSGWELRRDPLPLVQGGEAVVVPDFSFTKDGKVAWLEILGFWRKASLEQRVAATLRYGPPGLVLAVSKNLATDAALKLPDQVVPFAEVIPAKEVLKRIEALAQPEGAELAPAATTTRKTGARRAKKSE